MSNDTVARCLLQCFVALNLFQPKHPRIPFNPKTSFAATCFAALRILCFVSAIKQACHCSLLRTFPSLLAGTLKPTKISDAFDTGPPVVSRVIAIDNAMLRQQFKAAMDQREAKGGHARDSNDDLQVLRMSVPDIAEYTVFHVILAFHLSIASCICVYCDTRYSHARPVLLFHATTDVNEKGICCLGFRREFQASNSGVKGMIGNGVYFSTLPM